MSNKFPDVSDYLILDFINTRMVKHGKMHELLLQKKDFIAWFDTILCKNTPYNYQLKRFKDYFETVDDISEIISFRNSLYEQLTAFVKGNIDLIELQALIEEASKANPFSLVIVDNAVVLAPTTINQDSFQSIILLDLANLIANGDIDKLSSCANPECVILFINRTGRRKWCSMQICGNRKKVANFTKKKQTKNKIEHPQKD